MTALQIDGLDLSHYQDQAVDYAKLHAAGVKFMYHKATESTGYVDPNYSRRRGEAKKVGLPFGGYHFARPKKGNAEAEVAHFLEVTKPVPGDLCPALDLEDDGGLSQAELTLWVRTFVQAVKKAVGVLPVIYTHFNLDSNFGCLLWVPRYSNSNEAPVIPHPWKKADIWQFSDGQYGVPNQVPGVGHCDIDTFPHDLKVSDFTIAQGGHSQDTHAGDKLKKTGTFRVMTQNVKSLPLMPQPDVVADINLTSHQAAIVGWQEISPDRYRQAVVDLGPKWATFWGNGEPGKLPHDPWYDSPISWRTKYWDFLIGETFVLQAGKAGIAGTRYETVVGLQHKATGAPLIVMNGHFTAHPFGPTSNQDHDHDERVQLWHQDWSLVQQHGADLIKRYPHAALAILGDFNAMTDRDKKEFGPLEIGGRKIILGTPGKSIDQILLVNGDSTKWDVQARETMPGRNSDHQGRRVATKLEMH